MKPTKELIGMLFQEIDEHLDSIVSDKQTLVYYNEIMGDTSFLLAGVLESLLKENTAEWDHAKWMDDSLLTHVEIENDLLRISGIMIWGRGGTTEQWVAPFSFETALPGNQHLPRRFSFLFSDWDQPELSYGDFNKKRHYWEGSQRNWRYVIHSDEHFTAS
ncbi:hypothetical protein [Chitinophaga qingshengii]|uniref:Uncharacterized protein n=1 Tax=Chitinophaga qingshengii TaxID=1569794 RepID=A0ABR7TU22_9BACT|nr:hypothetical protein [Chitinophaga qingshengii]MBC9933118.1 hypothetical protein [Chitinophaga qingshengii]